MNDLTERDPALGPDVTLPVKYSGVGDEARVVIVQSLAYQGPHNDVLWEEVRTGFMVSGEEQPYRRRMLIKPEVWQPLDLGWVTSPSLVMVQHSPDPVLTNPTIMDRQRQAGQHIELLFGTPQKPPEGPGHLVLPQNEGLLLRLVDPHALFLRSTKDPAWVILVVLPQ